MSQPTRPRQWDILQNAVMENSGKFCGEKAKEETLAPHLGFTHLKSELIETVN
jgi:hypothetical protein